MQVKDVLGAESGSVKLTKKEEHVLLTMNEHDLLTMSESEFIDLCKCCTILGMKVLQDKELRLKKQLIEK